MIVAVSTNDGETLTRDHFGDGKYFYIYKLDNGRYELLDKIENKSPEEAFHGDPKKARAIGQMLSKAGVQVLVGFAMGPNIIRMRKQFVPVISRCTGIDDSLKELTLKYDSLYDEINKLGEKEVIFICQKE